MEQLKEKQHLLQAGGKNDPHVSLSPELPFTLRIPNHKIANCAMSFTSFLALATQVTGPMAIYKRAILHRAPDCTNAAE